jgi:hypothetical protein
LHPIKTLNFHHQTLRPSAFIYFHGACEKEIVFIVMDRVARSRRLKTRRARCETFTSPKKEMWLPQKQLLGADPILFVPMPLCMAVLGPGLAAEHSEIPANPSQ